MKFQSLSLIFAYLLASSISVSGDVTEEEWLDNYFLELRKTYDKRVPPIGEEGPGTSVKVSSTMFIIDIEKMDDSNMDFRAHFYFRQAWNDSRLKFKNRKDALMLRDVDDIWTPDLFFVEEREGALHHIIHPNILCRITPDGEVLYSVRLSLTFSCPMDLRSYPHDIQKCQINVESYAYLRKHIQLMWSDTDKVPLYASDEIKMLEYDLIQCNPSSTDQILVYGNYSRLEIHLTFKRKFGYFGTRLYVPFIILVLMSLLSFWVKAEEKCLRLALLLVILYLMITIASEVNSSTPQAPYTKASDVWIAFCESLVFAAFLEFIIVALIASRNYGDDSTGKREILLNMDTEAKEQTPMKSPLSKLINMFDARNGGNGRRNAKADQIDKICSIAFPIIFIIFNIVYWSMYCCS